MKRDDVPILVALLTERPARWVPQERIVGDYDSKERTLEVFNADARDQRRLLGQIHQVRALLEEAASGPLVVIFHSVRQSERYKNFLETFKPPPPRVITRQVHADVAHLVDVEDVHGPHRRTAA